MDYIRKNFVGKGDSHSLLTSTLSSANANNNIIVETVTNIFASINIVRQARKPELDSFAPTGDLHA